MKMIRFAMIVLAAAVAAPRGVVAAEASRPNIVLILSDDLGYGSAGCYGADGSLLRTPNIDRLAREGRRFTDANTTSSVCSPTRYSVMTGRYCWRTHLKSGVQGTTSPLHIETDRLTLASMLKSRGYRTAAVGKWHLGYGTSDGSSRWGVDYTAELSPGPLDIGFDYHFGVPANHGDVTGVYVENRFVYGLRSGRIPEGGALPGPEPGDPDFKADYTLEDTESGRRVPMEIDAPRRVNDRVSSRLTDMAVRWLEQQKSGEPFFLYFTPVAVHNPVTPSKATAGTSAAGPYGDWIHELDLSVGGILDALDRLGRAGDTLVIFTSDNGGVFKPEIADSFQTQAIQAGFRTNGEFRGGKHDVWEGGFRVPFLVRWPGKTPAGTVCNETISLADFLATTAAILGESLPPAARAAEDSTNILPALLGQPADGPLRPDVIVHSSDGVFAIRKGPWKWIEGIPAAAIKPGSYKTRGAQYRAQLYNVVDDPAETTNLADRQPDVAREMEALLNRYRDGGYSRELPPAAKRPEADIKLPPVSGAIIVNDPFTAVPKAPWVRVRGKWGARDGAVWGRAVVAEPGAAGFRHPLKQIDADIEYETSLQLASIHTLRVQCSEKEQVLLVHVTPWGVSIEDQARRAVLAECRAAFEPGTWLPVRVGFRGENLIVRVADKTIHASGPAIGQPKTAFSFLVTGAEIGFRNVRATDPARNE